MAFETLKQLDLNTFLQFMGIVCYENIMVSKVMASYLLESFAIYNLDPLKHFVHLQDSYQAKRIEWVFGQQEFDLTENNLDGDCYIFVSYAWLYKK